MPDHAYVDRLNRTYFGGGLSPAFLDRLAALPMERDDARAFIERMFRFMQRGAYPATDTSVFLADMLASLLSRLLPGRWEGRVPPITVAGRHVRIDRLVAALHPAPGRLIDVACGFPPLTTLDTADALTGWDILGVDRSLPSFLVRDGLGNYCTYDGDGRAIYFQPIVPTAEAWNDLLADWEGSRARFERLLEELRRQHAAGTADETADGASLTIDPAREFERPALRFQRSDLADLATEPADVVRCFNMLLYFDDAFRAASLGQVAALLREGGLFVCGTDWAGTTECRCFTYRKAGGRLVPQEFAFSLDNLAPFTMVPWYTLHDDDREVHALTTYTRALREDAAFIARFRALADRLRVEHHLAPRGPDGFYGGVDPSGDPAEFWTRVITISESLDRELAGEAAAALARAGHPARVNEVGHVAVRLPAG